MYRLEAKDGSFSIDILYSASGIENINSLRDNADIIHFKRASLKIAALEDVLRSKKLAGRPKDIAVIPIMEMTLHEKQRQNNQNV